MDGRLFDVRLCRPARVRPGQLRLPIRRASREDEEATQAMGDGAPGSPGGDGSRWSSRRPQLFRHGTSVYSYPIVILFAHTLLYAPMAGADKTCAAGWYPDPIRWPKLRGLLRAALPPAGWLVVIDRLQNFSAFDYFITILPWFCRITPVVPFYTEWRAPVHTLNVPPISSLVHKQ